MAAGVNALSGGDSHNRFVGATLYSPAATSDSSGFSERDSSGGFLSSGGGFASTSVTTAVGSQSEHDHGRFSLPGHGSLRGGGSGTHPPLNGNEAIFENPGSSPFSSGRVGSPSFFSYHNPTLTASPYSTLPRRMQHPTSVSGLPMTAQPSASHHQTPLSPFSPFSPSRMPLGAAGRNSPLMDMIAEQPLEPFNGHSSLPRDRILVPSAVGSHKQLQQQQQKKSPVSVPAATPKVSSRTPLLDRDDRESCV